MTYLSKSLLKGHNFSVLTR